MMYGETQEGVDCILLRKRKSMFGGRRNWPGNKEGCQPPTNQVEPYTAPDTMRKKKPENWQTVVVEE